ncbi:unnamed protein product, partial [Amoebophrya sp. A25]
EIITYLHPSWSNCNYLTLHDLFLNHYNLFCELACLNQEQGKVTFERLILLDTYSQALTLKLLLKGYLDLIHSLTLRTNQHTFADQTSCLSESGNKNPISFFH